MKVLIRSLRNKSPREIFQAIRRRLLLKARRSSRSLILTAKNIPVALNAINKNILQKLIDAEKFKSAQIILFLGQLSAKNRAFYKGLIELRRQNYQSAIYIFNKQFSSSLGQEIASSSVGSEAKAKALPHTGAKIYIFTQIKNNIRPLKPIYSAENLKFICLSEEDVQVDGWETIVQPAEVIKQIIIEPQLFFLNVEYSLYLDPTILIINNIDVLIDKYLFNNEFVILKSEFYENALSELEMLLYHRESEPALTINLYQQLKESGQVLPSLDLSFIWRSHSSEEVKNFTHGWQLNNQSLKDLTLSFYSTRLIQGQSLTFGFNLLSVSKNPYIYKFGSLSLCNYIKANINTVVFLYDEANKGKGSSVLRTEQLCELVKDQEGFKVYSTSSLNIQNSIIILNKFVCSYLSHEQLRNLKQAGNILIADLVDAEISIEELQIFDGLIASSIKQFLFFKQHSDRPVGYVLHHADYRLKTKIDKKDQCRIGYFGELSNMYGPKEIQELVDVISIDTSTQNLDWMNCFGDYNCHYAVRAEMGSKPIFKPFTKGIIAAHVRANIIVHENDGDAKYYLGEYYPYLVKGVLNPETVREKVNLAKNTFKGPTWEMGLVSMEDIRKKTSYGVMKKQFWEFVDLFIEK